MKTLLVVLAIFGSTSALACMNDMQCGLNGRCVKPAGNVSMYGTCVVPEDRFAIRRVDSMRPREVDGCQFNTDCSFGFRCMKEAGQMYGLCVR